MITPNPNDIPTAEQKQAIIDLLNSGVKPNYIFTDYNYPLEWAIAIEEELKPKPEIEEPTPEM